MKFGVLFHVGVTLCLILCHKEQFASAFGSIPSSTFSCNTIFDARTNIRSKNLDVRQSLDALYATKKTDLVTESGSNGFIQSLQKCNLYSRLVTIDYSELPVVGEIYASGAWKLCIIKSFKAPSSLSKLSITEITEMQQIVAPLAEVLMIEKDLDYSDENILQEHSKVVDCGQITTVLKVPLKLEVSEYANFLSKNLSAAKLSLEREFPVNHGEKVMQDLYESRMAHHTNPRARKPKALTKKEINRIALDVSDMSQVQEHVQQMIKKATKTAMGDEKKNSRLIDSITAASILMQHNGIGNKNKIRTLLSGALLLAMDADLGGRFKRTPSIHVSTMYSIKDGSICTNYVSLLNGGWMTVDESVRAGAEARKFVERNKEVSSLTSDDSDKTPQKIMTAADERIIYRLECLAMGEELGGDDDGQLEVDVRETLSALSLNKSQDGACQALIKLGRWSEVKKSSRGSHNLYEPWSSDVLDCARSLRQLENQRREKLYETCSQVKNAERKPEVDGRKDLTALPAICIDAKRASFRDDAIGLRRRASTGRKVKKGSKWELLFHIADVSDIYAPEVPFSNEFNLDSMPLRKAAEGRGTSRYDLPMGPLHLMPPVALEALALDTKRGSQSQQQNNSANRCVTLWAYLDDSTGRILDSGLERTIIQRPLALTFQEATKLLDTENEALPQGAAQTQQLLSIVDKSLSSWKATRLKSNVAAKKRESRMQVRELVAKETLGSGAMRDDGANGSFQRTKGHMVVDMALDLHGVALSSLLSRAKAPIPRASGSGMDRGGRLGTAPLRRYIDGVAQRQALSVLCNYGGKPMTKKECSQANKIATEAMNSINNLRSSKKSAKDFVNGRNDIVKRKKALRSLESHFASYGGKKRVVPAVSTGKKNQVVISGIGVMARCGGVKGSLKGGERISVEVIKLDPERDIIEVQIMRSR
mmetsp:Transcript_13807/g.20092  ORF Transcript_13807/g.20092 Transcript_13807/m.20092 type:complete len:935 (-) Transcript_13807:85-2889(-)